MYKKKKKIVDWIVDNILLAQYLTCVLRTLKTYKLTLRFLKYVIILVIEQNLTTKLDVSLGYNLTPYFFIGGKFWQIHH